MKSLLALALFAGLAIGLTSCNSTAYYGWSPNKELIYRFESQVLTGIPNLRSQYAGVKLSSDVIIQTFTDYSLRIKFQNPRFIVVNDELQERWGRPQIPKADQEVPEVLRKALTTPFVAHLKRGVVEAVFVERSEPVAVTNIKKALLTQLQLDLTASRKQEVTVVQQAHNSLEKNEMPKPLGEDFSYFTTEESSIAGDCQTSYTIHPLPKYQAMELEQRIREVERQLAEEGVIAGETSEGEQLCSGKEYFEITKTKHFDNCKERPTYQSIKGMKTNCDFSKAECKELMTQMSASRYIVCGTSRRDFIIRQAQTDNDVMTMPLGWNVTPEKMTLSARVTLMLLKVKSSGFQPLPKPQDAVEKKSLIYEFPRKSIWSTHESRDIAPRQENDKRGFQPILPMPDMRSGSALVPSFIPIQELREKIVEQMEKIVKEIFKSPESCSSKNDIAGNIHAIAQSLRSRSLEELEEIEKSLKRASFSYEDRKIANEIWSDILAMTGSNACVTIIKKKLESGQITGIQASRVLQSVLRNVKTPTQELLKEMIQLVKNLKSNRHIYNTGIIQLSNLIQHACIDPTERITQFPVRTYGLFCTRESEVVKKEFIPYLISQLEKTRESDSDRLIYIAALGKVGDKDILLPLVKVIESRQSPMVRSIAVYSLKRLAKLEPSIVRPLLLKIVDNPADNTEVRIAAVSILPWTQPSTAQLQKIAVRSWFEPSKQVASFIHSTLKSLAKTKVPELLAVGIKAQGVDSLVKPFQYGIQFSHNTHSNKFVEYLRTVSSVETAYVNTAESLFPARLSFSNQLYGGVWQIDGLTYSIYTNGMDKLVDKIASFFGYENEYNAEVQQELTGLREKLNIKNRQQEKVKEAFVRYSLLGFQRAFPVDKEMLNDIIEKVSEELRSNSQGFEYRNDFNLTYTNYAIKVRVLLPSMAGFPILIRRNVPVVLGIKGKIDVKWGNHQGSFVNGYITPVINGKVQSNMGIISPFTKKFIGSGVEASLHYSLPLAARAQLNRKGEFDIAVMNAQKNEKEFHALHAFVKPFTVVKSLERLVPLNKASSFKEIVSGKPFKQFELPLGRSVGIDAKLKVKADYKQLDFPFLWEKLRQHNLFSVWPLSFMPVSARSASVEILYNPAASETKEIEARFRYIHGKKLSEQDEAEVSYPSKDDILEGRKEEEIKELCRRRHEQSQEVRLCEEMEIEKLASRRESHGHVRRMLEKIASGRVNGLNVEASFNSRTSRNAVKTVLLIGSQKQHNKVKSFLEVKFQTPEKPAYEIEIDAVTEMPEMSYRWNIQELIKQNLKVETKVKARYGKVSSEKQEVEMEVVLSKSEHHKEAVRRSPELKKCEEEISKGRELSSVCIETRHQAASVDKIWMKVRVPQGWKKSQLLNKVEAATKAALWPVAYEEIEYRQEKQEQQGGSQLVFELDVLANRTADVAQAWFKSPFSKIHFKNITFPYQLRGFFPISLRNKVAYRLLQKVTRSQAPASCRVEDGMYSTFDNKTYTYDMVKHCTHLLFKDCASGKHQRNVAVTAKPIEGTDKKDVKIISGSNIVELKWKNSEVEIIVNGRVEPVPAGGSIYKKYSQKYKELSLVIHRTRGDRVVSVEDPMEGLEVFYDGRKIEVVAPQLLRNRACGLCGDMNGENTADLKSAQECVMRHAKHAAYTYIKPSEKCRIPEEDRSNYESDQSECIKTEHISTPLKRLAESLLRRKIQPISTKHVVEILENDVCISKSMIKVCGKGLKPVQVRQVELSFACLTRGYSRTEQILRRAEAGESILQVRDMPTEFSKKHVEAVVCKPEGETRQELEEEEEETRRRLNNREELENVDRLNVNRNANYEEEEEEERSLRPDGEVECRKNTEEFGIWQDSLNPAERIEEMCNSGKKIFEAEQGKMVLTSVSREGCKAAVKFAHRNDHMVKRFPATWKLYSSFTCGRMTVTIKA